MEELLNQDWFLQAMGEIIGRVVQRRRALVALYLLNYRRRKNRAIWVREWINRRNFGRGSLHLVQEELRLGDPASYRKYLRMDEDIFEELLGRVSVHIQKRDTLMRPSIPPRQRLAATLRFLASGNTYQDLAYSMRIPITTLCKIIPETLTAIIRELADECIKCPNTPEEWEDISNGFKMFWNFPHCVGALDGKHINFRPRRTAGSFHRNYKQTNSIVLLAMVDATYRFLFVDIGTNGRVNDAAVFRSSELGRRLLSGRLNLPEPRKLPGDDRDVSAPYVVVADDAFPLTVNLMKPYPSRGLTYDQRAFNYCLSRARRIVENAFGILANRFRILLQVIQLRVETVELITLACCILHNYILARKPVQLRNLAGEEDNADVQEMEAANGMRGLPPQMGNNPARAAKEVRDNFKRYFNSVGAVPWQHERIMNGA